MALRKIVKLGDDALRTICKPQMNFGPRLWTLLDDMAETMYDAQGVGLAAPQIGVLRRIIIVDVGEENGGSLMELINPEMVSMEGTQCGREGCLSLPGRQAVVTRPMKVVVKALNRRGEPITVTGEGLMARALCHEIDHLNGVLYIDLMDRELTREEMENPIPEDEED